MRDETQKRMTRRDMRREATRATVIEAARAVFLERGYEGATIKLISDRAEVSPGTVLNAAPSKAALLIQILDEEFEKIGEVISQLEGALSGSIADKLCMMLQASLEQQSLHSELFSAAYGHCWLYQDEVYLEAVRLMNSAWSGVRKLLEDSVAEGALRSDLDVETALQVLTSIYLGTFRRKCQGEITTAESNQYLKAQLDMVLLGMAQEI